ncbi:hypothetical protein [Bradyrhizobium sp. Leo121]|uniref:hypothetical protein n=1 Tax=Bradyrhizobium sp. Leo121 TaxID=1571195 RepID=UPI001029A1CD|nr:hypothetical protein [Bradyrhizobium sp. Leo121]RZN27205.1 hypothetical protein CWO90_25050 [Bradyrhizobium sp. Leo121]
MNLHSIAAGAPATAYLLLTDIVPLKRAIGDPEGQTPQMHDGFERVLGHRHEGGVAPVVTDVTSQSDRVMIQ